MPSLCPAHTRRIPQPLRQSYRGTIGPVCSGGYPRRIFPWSNPKSFTAVMRSPARNFIGRIPSAYPKHCVSRIAKLLGQYVLAHTFGAYPQGLFLIFKAVIRSSARNLIWRIPGAYPKIFGWAFPGAPPLYGHSQEPTQSQFRNDILVYMLGAIMYFC